jgi:hypothetical protein
MRRVLAALAVLLALATPARAQILWEGHFIIRGFSHACTDDFLADFKARFRPELPANGAGSHLMLFAETFTLGFWLDSGSFNSSFQLVDTVSVFESVHPLGPSTYLRFLYVSHPFSTGANFIDVTGQIKGWGGELNCVATFHMALMRRQEPPA